MYIVRLNNPNQMMQLEYISVSTPVKLLVLVHRMQHILQRKYTVRILVLKVHNFHLYNPNYTVKLVLQLEQL
jgi:hypothetical protein